MENEIELKLKELFNEVKSGNTDAINNILSINSLLSVNKLESTLLIEGEIEDFFNKQKENSIINSIISQQKNNLKYIKINDILYEIAPVNFFSYFSSIFKSTELKFIKYSYLLSPSVSQRLVLLSTLKGIV